MCMTVTTHPDVEFSTHMGIFRSPVRMVETSRLKELAGNITVGSVNTKTLFKHLQKESALSRPVLNLSGQLHAYAARKCMMCGQKSP